MSTEVGAVEVEGKAYQEIQSFWRSTNSIEDDTGSINATYTTQLREDTT
jgi:hypothetical protein